MLGSRVFSRGLSTLIPPKVSTLEMEPLVLEELRLTLSYRLPLLL